MKTKLVILNILISSIVNYFFNILIYNFYKSIDNLNLKKNSKWWIKLIDNNYFSYQRKEFIDNNFF